MREVDAAEIYGVRPHDNPYQLAWESTAFIRSNGRGKISWVNGYPAVLGAFTEAWPGVWDVWMFGTDQFSRGAMPLLSWVRHEARRILDEVGGHRLQCDSRFDHYDAHKMIKGMGAVQESVLQRYGKDGADYIRFVWISGTNDQVVTSSDYVRPIEERV